MKREHDLKRRLTSLQTLSEAVRAMKNLSAHHFREMRSAVGPADVYRQGVEQIAKQVGASLPAGPGPAGLLLIGGELGLCGAYNAQLIRAFEQRRRALGPGPTYCVGKRASRLAERHGLKLDRTYGASSSLEGITALLLALTQDLLSDYGALGLSRLEVVSSRFEGIGAHRPKTSVLLPLDVRGQPLSRTSRYVPAQRVSSVAVREFLYCTMYDLVIEAFAAEHGARLLATQAAEQWLDHAVERLRRRLTAAGREASTQEVIEIGAGARARSQFQAGPGTTAPHR